MRCTYYSYCKEPRYLCCNFCTNMECEKRCKDDHSTCGLYEKGDVELKEGVEYHITKIPVKLSTKTKEKSLKKNKAKKDIDTPPKALYIIKNPKYDLYLYKRFANYIAIKKGDKLPSSAILVKTTKNRALKKVSEINIDKNFKKGWVIECCTTN